ncbi:TRAP transporter small permease [Bordetella petrii]|jgi:TRAP-type C4-dicarboxylate transport system permease small subunit|uniref:TRAP transporter small permease n=1 Tax=Bordetella petrii TaxID=94624 RepID=UPI00047D8778|nr:TRAP transporter small permease subunit [Bordetella petrii]
MTLLLKVYRAVVAGATLAVAAILVIQVFSRYVLNSSLSWGEEVSSFLMIWAGLLGASTLARQDRYIAFSLFKESRRHAPRLAARLAAALATLVFAAILVWYGAQVSFFSAYSPRSSAAEIPLAWVYAIFPLAGLIALVGAILRIADLIRGRDE